MFFGLGLATKNLKGEFIEVFYPHPLSGKSVETAERIAGLVSLKEEHSGEINSDLLKNIVSVIRSDKELSTHFPGIECFSNISSQGATNRCPVLYFSKTDKDPENILEAYFKLRLLSHRQYKPHELKIGQIFKSLPNVAWTSIGAVDLEELPEIRLKRLADGNFLEVFSVDKFPKMTDYVIPSGIRIADTARVRLGAYVGEGTTVMHEGFINFNAGCEGPNMIEGRVSAGVFVGTGSDLGGGSSTMGTLSGGGNTVISVGKNCLIGANAGTGIPLGDSCTIESGLYITAGTKVKVLDNQRNEVKTVKAASLSGQNELLFIRNSTSGAVECLTRKNNVELNSELHSFN